VKTEINSLFNNFCYYAGLNRDFQCNSEENGRFAWVTFISNSNGGTLFKTAFDNNQRFMPAEWIGKVTVTVCPPRNL